MIPESFWSQIGSAATLFGTAAVVYTAAKLMVPLSRALTDFFRPEKTIVMHQEVHQQHVTIENRTKPELEKVVK